MEPSALIQVSNVKAQCGAVSPRYRVGTEREGFEPPIRLPVCRISSAVLSTTQPPLQNNNFNHLADLRGQQNPKIGTRLAAEVRIACSREPPVHVNACFGVHGAGLRERALHDIGGTIVGLHQARVNFERDAGCEQTFKPASAAISQTVRAFSRPV
jgi:hypothetical protein